MDQDTINRWRNGADHAHEGCPCQHGECWDQWVEGQKELAEAQAGSRAHWDVSRQQWVIREGDDA